MSFFFCFYDNENDNRNTIVPEEYRKNDIIDDESGNEEISDESDDTTVKKDPLMWDEVETFKNRLGTFDRKKLEEEKDMPDNLGINWFEQLPHYLGYNPVGP